MHLFRFVTALPFLLFASPTLAALLVDDFETKSQTNLLGATYYSFTDSYSTITPSQGLSFVAGDNSNYAGRFDFQLTVGAANPYVGVVANLSAAGTPMDVSAYEGARFYYQSQGAILFQLATTDTQAAGNDFAYALPPASSWQLIEIPFAEMSQQWGTKYAWNPQQVVNYNWTAAQPAPASGFLEIDNLQFYLASEALTQPPVANVILPIPKVNQVGYLPRGPKQLRIASTVATAGEAFAIEDASTNAIVFTGALSTTPLDDTAMSGESIFIGDFSDLTTDGTYVAVVGTETSHPFAIGANVYDSLFFDASRTFYLIRSGVAIDDSLTGIAHAASHTGDAILRGDGTTHVDLTGGWYNAGDMGKYSHMESIGAAYLMLLCELHPTTSSIALTLPESGNGTPDIVNQARWALTWLLKMQQADGGVRHKVDSEPNLPYGILPEDDPYTRYASSATSIDTGDFIAVMLQASHVFASIDPAFATQCHTAALSAWAWLQANPNIASDDPYYVDSDPSQEKLSALAAMVADSQDATLSAQLASQLASFDLTEVSWMAPELLSVFEVARSSQVDPALAAAAKSKIVALADSLVAKSQASAYRMIESNGELAWESVETMLHRADALFMAYELTANAAYFAAASAQLDWVLGENALDRSFVTAHGANPPVHPYHWIYASMGIVMPGWSVGGPNPLPAGADTALIALQQLGTPPAKCYVDQGAPGSGSWASNEGEVTDEAALVYAVGTMHAFGGAPTAPDAGSEPTATDAGTDATDAGPTSTLAASGGCGCSIGATRVVDSTTFVFAAMLAWILRRRRSLTRGSNP